MILKNPARNLQIPQTGAKKRTAIESNQIKLFMDFVKTSPQYSYAYPEFIFLFNTGVRIGELAGLTWDNVDFKNNMLTIDKTVNRYRKKDFGFTMALASPKSRTSVRTIPMNNEVRKCFFKKKWECVSPDVNSFCQMIPKHQEAGYQTLYLQILLGVSGMNLDS